MKQSFYSHGKLLISAEYLVLDGAMALAVPTQKGQWLDVEKSENKGIVWNSVDCHGKSWYQAHFECIDDKIVNLANKEDKVTKTLVHILETAKELNPNFLNNIEHIKCTTRLEFERSWGLGTSSTLINNIAQWAQVDAFQLLQQSFGGSGYDIACAQNSCPITYRRTSGVPMVEKTNFFPPFTDKLFFVYLNQKQDSKASIKHYRSLAQEDLQQAIVEVNKITNELIRCTNLKTFAKLLDQHEVLISRSIQTPTVKSSLFSDYEGSIKSLGGWGGDFVLATGDDKEYFSSKGFDTIISYADMVRY